MAAKRLSLKAFGAITLIAAPAAWLTGGAITFTSSIPGSSRIGLAPSPLWVAGWIAAAGIAFLLTRSSSNRFALLVLSGILLAPWLPGRVPAALYVWAGPLRGWLWTVLVAAIAVPAVVRRTPPWLTRTVRDPHRAPWLAAAVAAAAYLAGAWQILSAAPDRRRASLPRHRAEPRQGSRSPDREQPPPGRLPRLLRRRSETRLPPPRPERRNLLRARAGPFRSRRPGAGRLRISRRAGVPRTRQRVRDGADVDSHVARHIGRGGQLVRLGRRGIERAVRLSIVRGVPDGPGAALVMIGVLALGRRSADVDPAHRRHGRGAGAAAVAAHAVRRRRRRCWA